MKKNTDVKVVTSNQLLLAGALTIFVVILALQQGFFGSVLVTCTNYEPRSFSEFATAFQGLGGGMSVTDSFIIPVDGSLEKYSAYKSNSVLGSIVVLPMESMRCNEFLERVNKYPFYESNVDLGRASYLCVEGYAVINGMCVYNVCWSSLENITVYDTLSKCNSETGFMTTSFMNIERRQILSTQGGYMFCNKENNVALIVEDVAVLSNYVSRFETCTEIKSESKKDPVQDDPEEPVVVVAPGQPGLVNDDPETETVGVNRKVFNTVMIILIVLLSTFYVLRKKKVL